MFGNTVLYVYTIHFFLSSYKCSHTHLGTFSASAMMSGADPRIPIAVL